VSITVESIHLVVVV